MVPAGNGPRRLYLAAIGVAIVAALACVSCARGCGRAIESAAAERDCKLGDLGGCTAKCDKGHGRACTKLGLMYDEGDGVPTDDARARTLYRKACDLGDAAGCQKLAHMYEWGDGVPRDDKRAAALYAQACTGGVGPGCSALGAMYIAGRGVERDTARGADLLKKSCAAGDDAACEKAKKAGGAR